MIKIPYWWVVATPGVLFCLGAALNVIAITANGGTMPFIMTAHEWQEIGEAHFQMPPGYIVDHVHAIMTSKHHLKFICDWIQIGSGTASPGDLFVWLGRWLSPYSIGAWLALLWKKETVFL